MASNLLLQLRVLGKRRRFEQSCRWTPEQLAAHQRAQLAETLRFARDKSPFYARFHGGMENRPLEELPILTKSTMMQNFDELITDRSVRLADVDTWLKQDDGSGLFQNHYIALATSGSTGQRGVFLYSPEEWIECLASISRPMKWAGVRPRPFRPLRSSMVASTTPWHYSARVGRSLSTRMLPTLRLDAGEPAESMVRRLNDWRPHVLVAYPSVLRQLAEEQMAGRLRITPQFCATSAEVLTLETRRRIKEAWGVRVFETYGATEYAPIAAECAEGRRHLFDDGAIIENVDQRGKPVSAGELGDRVLLTIFNRRTQPLIRYEISDMIRISRETCECGRPFRCLEEIEGRQEDILYLPAHGGGENLPVHPNVFHRLLETVPAAAWQVIQEEAGMTVNLAGLRDRGVRERLASDMRELLEHEGVAAPPVRVEIVTELKRGRTGKAPLIIGRPRTAEARQ
jgi:putative adenylate-forming enzyme